jgi:hypothetical protein
MGMFGLENPKIFNRFEMPQNSTKYEFSKGT